MHDIWNPWHGCRKCSEGCENCYMYFLDRARDRDGAEIYRTQSFYYPLQKRRDGSFQIRSGELIRVCMTSDFFLEDADPWRSEAWEIMRQRGDVKFYLLTKRPERVRDQLPPWWGDGLENVMFNVTCENQRRADERVPLLLSLPFRHKGVMCAPLIGGVSLKTYLADGQIEQVACGGENYGGRRPCRFEWVQRLRAECEERDVTFCFLETGSVFLKDGKRYFLPQKRLQSEMAFKSGMGFAGKPIRWRLTDPLGLEIPAEQLYTPRYREACARCGGRLICNGCSDCGKCGPAASLPSPQTF